MMWGKLRCALSVNCILDFKDLVQKKIISVPSTQFCCEPKTAIKNTTIFMGERVEGIGRLGVWDWHVLTAIFKIDN